MGIVYEAIYRGGDTIFEQGEKTKTRSKFAAAKTEYEKALAILENPEYAADKFGYSSEMLRTLKLKITDCDKHASSSVWILIIFRRNLYYFFYA